MDDSLQTEGRARLAVDGSVGPGGEFEVLAITAGEGNGWLFGAEALRESLALWQGAECFIDHAYGTRAENARSLRDLAGVLYAVTWDDAAQGIKARLRPVGPSAPLLVELGRQMVEGEVVDGTAQAEPPTTSKIAPRVGFSATGVNTIAPRVGFSADVVFTAQGQRVEKILRVLSVDLVFNPARGGAFLRALNSIDPDLFLGGNRHMEDSLNGQANQNAGAPAQAALNLTAAANHLAAANNTSPITQPNADTLRAEMCALLLESSLASARLPQPVSERVRQQFSGRTFQPGELTRAIDDARRLVSDLTGPALVQGARAAESGHISGMLSSEEQFSAALYDLMGAGRPNELAGAHVSRLSGIRELYTLMTGDAEFIGGYNPTRARFATTADLPAVLKNAMNKLIAQQWDELGRSGYRWWEPVVSVEHFNNLQPITGIQIGEVTVLPKVDEGAAYSALSVSDSAETADWAKYGGYIGLTLEMFERDETHKLRAYPKKLASAGLRRISELVGSVFTASAGVGPAMADGKAVFHADHSNLGSLELSSAGWEAASQAIYTQPLLVAAGGTAPNLAVDARYLLVPRALRLVGRQILYPSFERESGIFSENLQRGELGDVITVPEFTDANNWAAVADPRLAPGIILAERFGVLPEVFIADHPLHGALFTNDEIRMKVRHWVSVFVADHRPLYKSNVA